MSTTNQHTCFVMMGLQPWDIEIGSNFKNMADELSKQYPVLYINRALDRISAIRQRKDAKIVQRKTVRASGSLLIEEAQPNLFVLTPTVILESINWISHAGLFDWFNKMNNQRLAADIEKGMQQLNFKNPYLLIDNDFFRGQYLNELLPVKATIYYIRDYLNAQPYFSKHGNRLEPALLAKANCVVANSKYLSDYGKQYNKHSYDIGQGCDFSGLSTDELPCPDDLASIPKPIIGYTGALIQSRLGIELLEYVAQHVKASLVLVGPEDEAFRNSKLHQMSNVHFLGTKPASSLYAYIQHFDVCINPQVLNQLTIGNYPRKIDEYLALGKDIVATKTVAMEMFEPYVKTAATNEEFAAAIASCLQQPADATMQTRRRAFALSHTWASSITAMFNALQHADI
ncbi:glycosyltransferase [Phnomibacter sp. MR]|uniref:glycosyltransferase n=1 Tax=Phnomibacter sp. MR TaxID=3042318 RepID=UPI003A807D06